MPTMSFDEFAAVVERVIETLPESIRQYMDNVVIDIQERPTRRQLREAGFTDEEIRDGDSLYGLFVPMDLPLFDDGDFLDHPHQILIFQEPLEEDFPDPKTLRMEIRRTVIHELAHHFGWSERDLDRFESKDDPWPGEDI